jgi:hypothetical protein
VKGTIDEWLAREYANRLNDACLRAVGSHSHFWHYPLDKKMHLIGLSTGTQTLNAIHRNH